MPQWRDLLTVLVVAGALSCVSTSVEAGGFLRPGSCCGEAAPPPTCAPCCKIKKRCCFLLPKEPPRGEVAFSIPARVTEGQAVRVSPETVRRGIRSEAARELSRDAKPEAAGVNDCPEACLERIEALEKRLDSLAASTTRLAKVVDNLNSKLDASREE